MHTDARSMENDSLIEGDICIVGAGAAGISIALEWINSSYKVVLLEGGGFNFDEKVQELYKGKTTGQRYYPLQSSRLHYFGGTTGHWAGFCSPLDPIDFQKRDWVAHSGWPIKREDLDVYYARAHQKLELGPYEYSLEYWQKKDPAMLPILTDSNGLWNKMWQFSPPTQFGKKYKDPILKSTNVHLYTFANVVDITTHEGGAAVKELTARNFTGKTQRVRAKYFVLCCCAIQNARLLLASNKQASAGLGNDRDQVGRYFMEHLEIKSAELWLTRPDPMKLYMLDFGVTKARAEIAITASKQEEFKILNGTVSLTPLEIAKKIKPAIETWSHEDPRKSLDQFLGSIMDAVKEPLPDEAKLNRSFELFTRVEQAPNPASRVTLDSETDALGMPRAILHWELTPLEKRSIRKIDELIGLQVGIAGIGRVKLMDYLIDEKDESWPDFAGGGWHHMGTTRMSDTPQSGVVDADCKVHGIANLFVGGSSCFATAGAPNPTLSLVALSLRLSDHLKHKMKG
jgi:choline dehydrogenase-like flavoprotein